MWVGHSTIWRMCIACWIPKATKTLSEYVILINCLLEWWLHVCAVCYIICTWPVMFSIKSVLLQHSSCSLVRPCVVENHVIKVIGLVDRKGSGSNFYLRTGRRDHVIANTGMRKFALYKQRPPIRQMSYSQLALTQHAKWHNWLYFFLPLWW